MQAGLLRVVLCVAVGAGAVYGHRVMAAQQAEAVKHLLLYKARHQRRLQLFQLRATQQAQVVLHRAQVRQPQPEHLHVVFPELPFLAVVVDGIAAGFPQKEHGDTARQQLAGLVIAAPAAVRERIETVEDIREIMADGFVHLPYDGRPALAGTGLLAF